MTAYKLFRETRTGIAPLFINRRQRIPLGVWLDAEVHPTRGYALRPGWHCAAEPKAPHLSLRGRRWYRVQVQGFKELKRPACQGRWILAKRMKVIEAI